MVSRVGFKSPFFENTWERDSDEHPGSTRQPGLESRTNWENQNGPPDRTEYWRKMRKKIRKAVTGALTLLATKSACRDLLGDLNGELKVRL